MRKQSVRVWRRVAVVGSVLGGLVLALGFAGSASAAPTTQFFWSTPGFTAGATQVPGGICFVTSTPPVAPAATSTSRWAALGRR